MRKLPALAAIVAALVIAGCGSSPDGTAANGEKVITGPQISAAQPPSDSSTWPPNYTELARRARLRGIPDPGSEKFHIHEQLHIYNDGILLPIAPLIGLDVKRKVAVGLHTHEAEGPEASPGVIHMEADKPFQATLGDFFAVWGVKFGGGWLGGLHADGKDKLRSFVNGREISDPATYVLRKNDNIVIAFGSTSDFPRAPDTTALKNANTGKGGCSLGTKKDPRKSCIMDIFRKKKS